MHVQYVTFREIARFGGSSVYISCLPLFEFSIHVHVFSMYMCLVDFVCQFLSY